ncbi:MAG: RNA polymerase factor sigma-54, partial [Marinobacter sp.]|nr:RNA polymerase factor sigma-54 [Marinobacter sp.]
MKASLQLKMGQSLTMTPQLQQAIRLLQLSTLDLQQEIQQALESNPMLEAPEDDDPVDSTAETDSDNADSTESAADSDPAETSWDESETGPDWASETEIPSDIPDDLPV